MGLFGKKSKKDILLQDQVEEEKVFNSAASGSHNLCQSKVSMQSGEDSSSSSDGSYDKINQKNLAPISFSKSAITEKNSMNSSKLEAEIRQIYEGLEAPVASNSTKSRTAKETEQENIDANTDLSASGAQATKSKMDGDVEAPGSNSVTSLVDNTKAAGIYVRSQAEKLRARAQEGPLPFSILAFLGGIAIVITNALDLIFELFHLSPLAALMSVYCIIFGVVICKMEGRRWEVDTSILPIIYQNVGALKFVWGRGCFYVFAGTIQFSKLHIDDLIVGLYISFVGIASIMVGRGTASKLATLSNAMEDKKVVCEKFMAYDSDEDGFLTYAEFKKMIKDLGLELDHNELDVALFVVDQDQDDKISYEEFVAWWEGFHEKSGEDVRSKV